MLNPLTCAQIRIAVSLKGQIPVNELNPLDPNTPQTHIYRFLRSYRQVLSLNATSKALDKYIFFRISSKMGQFAKYQPASFTNRIERVAIVGVSSNEIEPDCC